MCVIDLGNRLTNNSDTFQKYDKSSDSFIFNSHPLIENGNSSAELSVGRQFFHCNEYRFIETPEEGIVVNKGMSVVIETKQAIGVPSNSFGLVTGKGTYIWQGVFISSGKIDPGFYDHLRISIYNSGNKPLILKKDDPFCSVCFFQLESNPDVIERKLPLRPPAESLREIPLKKKMGFLWSNNWVGLIGIIIASLSLIVSVYVSFFRKEVAPQPVTQPSITNVQPENKTSN